MFKLRVAEYINTNMQERKWTYRDLSLKSGVADSSIHSYAQGRVTTPNEDNLIRIAAAFGDSPDVIQEMRRESLGSTVQENKLLAEAADKERMERFIILMRENMLQVMEEYRSASEAQQTEIIQHTDKCIEEERARFKERAAEVVKQCNEEMERSRAFYEQRCQMTVAHCEQRVADAKQHMADVLAERRDSSKLISRQYARNRAYLKSSVRNLCAAGCILLITNIFFGAYAIFAYTAFDMNDPTRGLHRETHSIGPMMLFLAIVSICVAAALVVSMFTKRPKAEEEEE